MTRWSTSPITTPDASPRRASRGSSSGSVASSGGSCSPRPGGLVEILASIVQRLDADEHEIRDLRGQIDDLRRRHDDQSAKLPATMAFGWDYVAMVRRLAVLEEHVDTLLAARPEAATSAAEPAPVSALATRAKKS